MMISKTLVINHASGQMLQPDGQVYFHVLRIAVEHGIQFVVNLGHASYAVFQGVFVGFDPSFVLIKPCIWIMPSHAYIDARFVSLLSGIGLF